MTTSKASNFGFVIGAGLEAGHLTLDGRYMWGLSNINADPLSPDVKVKNRVFSIRAGFRF
jgi:hypothetical protein